MMIQAKYKDIRHMIQQGDDFMFGGPGFVPATIKLVTDSPVSHIASVFQTYHGLNNTKRVRLIESTQLGDVHGVQTNYASKRIADYKGCIWWCPLSEKIREHFDEDAFFKFMYYQENKKYDLPQAIKSAIDIGVLISDDNKEDFSKLFCSELRTGALEIATPPEIKTLNNINASEYTPADCCAQKVHDDIYYQLVGPYTEIHNLNQGLDRV